MLQNIFIASERKSDAFKSCLPLTGISVSFVSSSEDANEVMLLELFDRRLICFGDCDILFSSTIVSSWSTLSLLFNFFLCLYSVMDSYKLRKYEY